MVLHHVAQRAGLLVEGPAPLHANRLGGGNLHAVDKVPVPDWLKYPVAKPEDQDVLHRLLAQVVVNAEDLLLVKDRVHVPVQRPRALQVVPKRLLNHHPNRALVRVCHLVCAQVLDNRREILRRSRQIKQPVAANAVGRSQRIQLALQSVIACRVVKVHGKVVHLRQEACQLRIRRIHIAKLQNPLAHIRGKFVANRPPRHAQNHQLLRQQSHLLQMEERRQQLALGQVARRAKNHQNRRLRYPLCPCGYLR